MRRAPVAVVTLIVAWLFACAFLFVWPDEDVPLRADAVVVLAGDARYRVPRALELVDAGVADELVLSRELSDAWRRWERLCDEPSVECFDAEPYSTRGEASAIARIVRRRGWRAIVVVTSSYHVFRARMLLDRCLDGEVAAVGAEYDERWLPLILPAETAKLVRALTTQRNCAS